MTNSTRILDWVDSFGDPLTLYREVYLKSLDEIDFKNLGIYWTPERDKAHSPYGKMDNIPGTKPYLLIARVPRNYVDDSATISAMKRYPGEREIRLKKKALVRILDIIGPDGKSVRKMAPTKAIASSTHLSDTVIRLTLQHRTAEALCLLGEEILSLTCRPD